MEKTYKTVGEVKERISALLKEGYVFSDIYRGDMCFGREKDIISKCMSIKAEYITISLEKDGFIEKTKSWLHFCYKIIGKFSYENYVFDILDFYVVYGVYTLYLVNNKQNIISFRFQHKKEKKLNAIDVCDKIQLSEEILGEIFFARNIIEEYARKGIYDILRECCEMPQN